MKIALPLTATEEFSTRYGASIKFIVFDVDPIQRAVQGRLVVVPQASEPCEWPRFLRAAGVDLVLAGGMGRGARQHMAEHGVQVLTGVPAATPDEIMTAWLEGKLVTGENACDGSGVGAHHHDHHHHGPDDHHAHGGLGLFFTVQPDGAVAAEWICPPGGEGFRGIVHGGLLATALDSAMVHALFAHGILASTAELNIRYRHSARVGEVPKVRATLGRTFGHLHELEAEIHGGDLVRAPARARFMAGVPGKSAGAGSSRGTAKVPLRFCPIPG